MKLFFLFNFILMTFFQSSTVHGRPLKGSVIIEVDSGQQENLDKINSEKLKVKNSCFKDSLHKIESYFVKKIDSVQEKLVNPLDFLIDTHILFRLAGGTQKIQEVEIKFSLRKNNSVMPIMINSFRLSSPDVCLSQSSNLELSSIVILSDIQKKYNTYLQQHNLLPKITGENKQKEGGKKEEARTATIYPNQKAQRSPSYLPEEASPR